MRRPARGFTLIEVLVVSALVAALAALSIPVLLRSRMTATGAGASATLRLLVAAESIWASQDADRNGKPDYWTLDVRGFYGIRTPNGAPVAVIDPAVAMADRNPAVTYAAPVNRTEPKSGYYYRAMTRDQDNAAYVDRSQPAAQAAPVARRYGTNPRRFGFTAYPAQHGTDGVMNYMVNEDGVIWQYDSPSGPFLNRSQAAPPGRNRSPRGPWTRCGE